MLAAVAARLRHHDGDLVWVDLGGGTGVSLKRNIRTSQNCLTFIRVHYAPGSVVECREFSSQSMFAACYGTLT